MTTLEKVELAIRRTISNTSSAGYTPIYYYLEKLADELAKLTKEEREAE